MSPIGERAREERNPELLRDDLFERFGGGMTTVVAVDADKYDVVAPMTLQCMRHVFPITAWEHAKTQKMVGRAATNAPVEFFFDIKSSFPKCTVFLIMRCVLESQTDRARIPRDPLS